MTVRHSNAGTFDDSALNHLELGFAIRIYDKRNSNFEQRIMMAQEKMRGIKVRHW